MKETTYETGATTHAVNNLILFTDNTRELAELRDEIYGRFKSNCMPLKMEFIHLSAAACERYRREFNQPEFGLTPNELSEFTKLYADDFDNWKREFN